MHIDSRRRDVDSNWSHELNTESLKESYRRLVVTKYTYGGQLEANLCMGSTGRLSASLCMGSTDCQQVYVCGRLAASLYLFD